MVAVPRVSVVMTLLFLQKCGAFVAPRSLAPQGSASVPRLGVSTSSASGYTSRHVWARAPGQAATMVLAGLPSKTERTKGRPWEEDFPTTVAKAAFASLKDKARYIMVKGAEKRGLDWTGIVEALQVCLLIMLDPLSVWFFLAVLVDRFCCCCCCCVRFSDFHLLLHQGPTLQFRNESELVVFRSIMSIRSSSKITKKRRRFFVFVPGGPTSTIFDL